MSSSLKNLEGKVFTYLTVIEQLEGRRAKYLCKCKCGNTKEILARSLITGSSKSCGCLQKELLLCLKPGDVFGKLTVLSYNGNEQYLCLCECGNQKLIKTKHLKGGHTRSCGCLRRKKIKVKQEKPIVIKDYRMMTAKARYRNTYYEVDSNLTFEKYYELSQMNCTYCGAEPSNKVNNFKVASGEFICNGIDRIDSSKNHTLENCVTCCWICNKAKSNKTILEFKNYIIKLKDEFNEIKIVNLEIPNKYIRSSCVQAYGSYKRSETGIELDLQTFYNYSQCECYYCGTIGYNKVNKHKWKGSTKEARKKGEFRYNGLDRIDSKLGHTLENVLPCCRVCNMAKGTLSIEEFKSWIKRIKAYSFSLDIASFSLAKSDLGLVGIASEAGFSVDSDSAD